MDIKQSTPFTLPFVMVDEDNNELTGLTVTVEISKAGGAFAAAAGVVAEIGDGWYAVALTAADTGTLGALAIKATATGALQQNLVCNVLRYTLTDIAGMFTLASASTTVTLSTCRTALPLVCVFEGEDAFLTVAFTDENGATVAPSAVTWRVVDVNSGTELKAETAVSSPTETIVITIPASVNALVNDGSMQETHRIILDITYNDALTKIGRYDYLVTRVI
jgi:hypothetical protein